MLTEMQTDSATELVATVIARIFWFTEKHGESEETKANTEEVLAFKRKVVFEYETLNKSDIKEFSQKWLSKYPSSN